MAPKAQRILEDALTLPEEDRKTLVEALSDSLTVQPVELPPGWNKEIANRISQLETGEVEPISGSDVDTRIQALIDQQ